MILISGLIKGVAGVITPCLTGRGPPCIGDEILLGWGFTIRIWRGSLGEWRNSIIPVKFPGNEGWKDIRVQLDLYTVYVPYDLQIKSLFMLLYKLASFILGNLWLVMGFSGKLVHGMFHPFLRELTDNASPSFQGSFSVGCLLTLTM